MNSLETLLSGQPLIALGAAFSGGLLASLAPCTYPLLPIVSAYVGSRTDGPKNRLTSFFLSLAYVVGMALVYACMGMFAALTGSFFGQVSSSPWALILVANVLLLVALNIFGVVPFPSWFSGRTLQTSVSGVPGAFLIGAATGLVASPCTSPVLFGLLTYVATTKDAVFGGALVFVFSLGMGALLVVAGTFSGFLAALPKPGQWMVRVKTAMGVLILLLAEYYLLKAGQVWI